MFRLPKQIYLTIRLKISLFRGGYTFADCWSIADDILERTYSFREFTKGE